jgi:anti-sigma regulatory factor (Ser/Thr protein kinase)
MASGGGFRHEAFFYEGLRGFGDWVLTFISDELARGALVLVMADPEQTALVRQAMRPPPLSLRFEDARSLGTNPGRLMPRWTEFVAEAAGVGRPLVGVGALRYQRTPAERIECELHEALLNVAFAEGASWRLVCPFDTGAEPDVADEARRTHPAIIEEDHVAASPSYLGVGAAALTLGEPLPKPPAGAAELAFERAELSSVRDFLRQQLVESSLSFGRIDDLLLATHEAATNCIRHGGGAGRIQVWREDGEVVCDVSGNGRITDPLVGRRRPDPRRGSGMGLWIVHQVCDLVQLRSNGEGTVVRMHMRLPA